MPSRAITSSLPAVTVLPGCLLASPVTFDGFDPVRAVSDWAERSWPSRLGSWDLGCAHPAFGFVDERVLLAAFVREFVRPAVVLPGDVEVVCSPDGIVELCGVPSARSRALLASGARVTVSGGDVSALCDAVFPQRGRGWLAFYAQVRRLRPMLGVTAPADRLLGVEQVLSGSVVDAFARVVSDDALGLAAEVVAAGRLDLDVRVRALQWSQPQAAWTGEVESLVRGRLFDALVGACCVVDERPGPSVVATALRAALDGLVAAPLVAAQPSPDVRAWPVCPARSA